MKKTIKNLTCVFLGVLSLMLAACGDNKLPNINNSLQDNTVIINDFENQMDLNALMMYNYLGKVETEQNNQNLISSGKASIKITVQSDKFNGNNSNLAYLYLATHNSYRGVDMRDFTDIEEVGFDIYNAQDIELRIGVRLIYYRNYDGGTQKTDIRYFKTAAKQWTNFQYPVDTDKIPKVKQTLESGEEKTILQVIGIDILFYVPNSNELDRIFYLDKFYVLKNAK